MTTLTTRLERFGLSLLPQTFDFLEFTHYCARKRDGRFAVGRRTSRKRLYASIRAIEVELRRRLHAPMHVTGRWLSRVVAGHWNYFAVPGNLECVSLVRYEVRRRWFKMLRQRNQRQRHRSVAPVPDHP